MIVDACCNVYVIVSFLTLSSVETRLVFYVSWIRVAWCGVGVALWCLAWWSDRDDLMAYCGVAWHVPRHYPSCPRKYPYLPSPLYLAHSVPSLAHSAPFFVLSARFLFLGTIPLLPRRNFSFLHSQCDPSSASWPWRDPYHSSRPQRDPCHSSHPGRNLSST